MIYPYKLSSITQVYSELSLLICCIILNSALISNSIFMSINDFGILLEKIKIPSTIIIFFELNSSVSKSLLDVIYLYIGLYINRVGIYN